MIITAIIFYVSELLKWLCGIELPIAKQIVKYKFNNTGVNIERYAATIAIFLSRRNTRLAMQMFIDGRGEDALLYIYNNLLIIVRKDPTFKKMLARLIAVVKYSNNNIKLPNKCINSQYTITPKNILYVVHMRAPIVNNGYAARTTFILKLLHAIGCCPIGVTRLAFPNELVRYRKVKIKTKELVGDTNFYALLDSKHGLNLRAIDDYINAYSERLVDIAKIEKAAIIHASSNYVNGLAAIVAGRILGIPSIYEVRGLWHLTRLSVDAEVADSIKFKLEERMELQAINNADRVIVISEALQKYFIKNGINKEKMFVVPNGVDIDRFVPHGRATSLADQNNISDNVTVIGYN